MNFFKSILATCILTSVIFSGVHAQSIDQKRMNRDLNISKQILGELFKTKFSSQDSSIKILSGSFSFSDNHKINGTYIQDYGVIFNIPAPNSGYVINTKGNKYEYQFQNTDDEQKEVTKTTIIHRIREFLRNYGTTISQLKDDDRITVIYNSQSSWNHKVLVLSTNDNKGKDNTLPTISVTAKKSDLEAFRKGTVDSSTLDNRMNVSTVEKGETDQTDLTLMDNIFSTAFEDPDVGEFEIKDNVSHIYLDDLGVLFSLDASYNSSLYGILAGLGKKFSGKITVDSLSVSTKNNRDKVDEDDKKMQELKAERKKSYQTFKTQLKELLIDYGRTLKSIPSDERIFLSVSVSSPGDQIPEHVNLQLKKSVLEAVDKGGISRHQAINKITVREY